MPTDADVPVWPALLAKLMRGEDLAPEEAGTALATILEGRATPAQIAGFAVALRAKGETAAEMAALVRTMLDSGRVCQLWYGISRNNLCARAPDSRCDSEFQF